MVSKAAVIAIIGILAVPILMGYAFNMEQTTETDYKVNDNSPVNVTQLLQNDVDYQYANGDIYNNNTQFGYWSNGQIRWGYLPEYVGFSYVKSSLPLAKLTTTINGGHVQSFSSFERYYFQKYSGSINITPYGYNQYNQEVAFTTFTNVKWLDFERSKGSIEVSADNGNIIYSNNFTRLEFSNGSVTALQEYEAAGVNIYVDFSKGFISNTSLFDYNTFRIGASSGAKSVLISMNLNSITAANYQVALSDQALAYNILLSKTTTDGVVSWTATNIMNNVAVETVDLYYDPARSDNTYQFLMKAVGIQRSGNSNNGTNEYHTELRYVGSWPTFIGEANYYQKYEFEPWVYPNIFDALSSPVIRPMSGSVTTPIMRVDNIEYKSVNYQVISNQSYNPASFKINPQTAINDPILYGTSIAFGGNTYSVKEGKITIDNHDIPVKGLKLSSVPNPNGGYDNKIGNTVISTTAQPSTITFNGKWSASITTSTQEDYEVTKTEWKAGSFAWDGIDQNFLMVGLITSLGVFIALGIYARRSRATIWPIMLVCGGAALLFFVML